MPVSGCRGNHEGSAELLGKYFPYPYQTDGYYYSFDYGPVHVAVIDQYVNYSPGSSQYLWLQEDLAQSTKEWKFLVFHEPGWSAGGHGNNIEVQGTLQNLALQYGVDFMFSGHNHYYSRALVGGIQHITSGGGGAPLYSPDNNQPNIVATSQSYHFCELDVQGEDLFFTARDESGIIIDSFSMKSRGSEKKFPWQLFIPIITGQNGKI